MPRFKVEMFIDKIVLTQLDGIGAHSDMRIGEHTFLSNDMLEALKRVVHSGEEASQMLITKKDIHEARLRIDEHDEKKGEVN